MQDPMEPGLAEAAPGLPALPTDAEARALASQRWRTKWGGRAAVWGLCALTLGGLHWLLPAHTLGQGAWFALLGVTVGLLTADLSVLRQQRALQAMPELITNDLARLEQCFAILQKQVAVSIRTSEVAVMEMVERLHNVHLRTSTLQQRIEDAVGRSQVLSQGSLHEAGRNGQTLDTLAEHQRAFGEARQQNQERIRAVVEQVRLLTPLATLISDISRQTNLLSVNASIEAARAGPEGAGFKVVATEVRRLSTQTSEAAQQISRGIQAVATAIDGELSAASRLEADGAAGQIGDLAQHITDISERLSEVVPYLNDLSSEMDAGMQSVTTDIIDAMGHMQFQDINRQLLTQVETALGSLAEHSAALYALIGGKAPPPPQALEELMQHWVDNYVMQEQRSAHAEIEQRHPSQPQTALQLDMVSPGGPRIELF